MRIRPISIAPVLLLLGAGIVGCDQEAQKPAPKKDAAAVLVAEPVYDEVTDFEEFSGHTDAVKTVEVRARVTGYLEKIFFEDGIEIPEGVDLFLIDPRPYQAELNRTEATVTQSDAHLKRLDADLRRASNLYKRGAISQEEVDRIQGDYSEAEAAVGIAKANRDLAKLNLSFTKVTAPIGGRLSRRLVDPGNMVQADTTPLTTIVTLDPMYVYFDIDERTLLRIRRLVREGKVRSRSEAEVPVLAGLSDEEGTFPHQGTINFSENKVDAATGTLRIRGIIPNPKSTGNSRVLSPGLFMRIRLPVGTPRKALLIPEQAIRTDQGRKSVYVVVDAKDNKGHDVKKAVTREVKTGLMKGKMRVIEEGLRPGEQFIVSGLQRVKPGATVDPKLADDPTNPTGPAETKVAAKGGADAPAKKPPGGE